MRRLRIALAGAALTASTLLVAGPAHAANDNSDCRTATNQVRKALHAGVQAADAMPSWGR